MNNAPDGKNRRVLVIDDNRSIHDDFRKILSASTAAAEEELEATAAALFETPATIVRHTQFEVDSAYQGQEGVLLAKKALEAGRPYAMAFVDVRMPPGWDGVETTQKIWELDPDLQVVLCTAYSDYSWDEIFTRLGRRDGLLILKKPFDAVEAIQLAHALTEKWWLHQVSRQQVEELESRVAERTRELGWKTAFLEAQVSCSIDGILVVDEQGRKILQNQRLIDLLKIPQAIADDPDDRDQIEWVTNMARAPTQFIARVRHLYAHPGEIGQDEFEMKDGTVIDRYSAPVIGKTGEYYGRIWVLRDITARKRAEEELFQSRETLRGILDHIPQRVFWKDRDLIYQGCNQAFAVDMGFSEPADVIGKTDFEATWKVLAEHYQAHDRSVIDLNAAKSSFEEPAVAPDGRPMWIRTSLIPLHDQQGRVTGVLGTYEDITPHKLAALEIETLNADLERRVEQRTEELFVVTREAKRANRAKSEFLSRTSHELRTPLNAILGFGQLLATEENLGPEARESTARILNAARHLLALIDKVLDISDADAGRVTLATEPVAVDRLIAETLSLVRPLSAALGVDLELQSSPEQRWSVLAEPKRLQKALFHLLSNALKYNRPRGKVILECAPIEAADPPAFRFRVTDTGPGISAENLPRLFTPFDRLDVERTRTPIGGTGLGLALARRVVEQMGGRLGVESTLGEGSTFWIEVPWTETPAAPGEQSTLPAGRDRPSETIGSRTVLYIEEDLSNLRLITRMVARRPAIQLRSAATHALGLEMAREHGPTLILLALRLTDSRGEEILALLQVDPRTAAIPVLVLGADDRVELRGQMIAAGARAFLTKPLEVRTFLAALDQFIEPTA